MSKEKNSLIGSESKLLDKGAVPRITQEIYFTMSEQGKITKVNAKLTMLEFSKKLEELNKCYELFDNIDRAIEEEINK